MLRPRHLPNSIISLIHEGASFQIPVCLRGFRHLVRFCANTLLNADPLSGFIQREAISLAPEELVRQKLKMSMEETLKDEDAEQQDPPDNTRRRSLPPSPRPASSIRSFVRSMITLRLGRTPESGWENLQV